MIKTILCFAIMFNSFCRGDAPAIPPFVTYEPKILLQGQPFLVEVGGVTSTTTVESMSFAGQTLYPFKYKNRIIALYGIDMRMTPGEYEIVAKLADNTEIKRQVTVFPRKTYRAPLGIPDKMGGNTYQAEKKVVASLSQQNSEINSLLSSTAALWSEKFGYPLKSIIVSDPYGYTRTTGTSLIAHKGTDFVASIGTQVYAMNDGIVRFAAESPIYGKMIVIDHGLSLMTMYLHLSQIGVKEGDTVKKGQPIGLSGDTGYAIAPHLHVSVRLNNVSIDPMKFMELFK